MMLNILISILIISLILILNGCSVNSANASTIDSNKIVPFDLAEYAPEQMMDGYGKET